MRPGEPGGADRARSSGITCAREVAVAMRREGDMARVEASRIDPRGRSPDAWATLNGWITPRSARFCSTSARLQSAEFSELLSTRFAVLWTVSQPA